MASGRSISRSLPGITDPRCLTNSANSSIVSELYTSPPAAVGSTNGTRPDADKKSAHLSRAVVSRLLSVASRTHTCNDARRAATLCRCAVVGSPPSHSSPRRAVSAPVSCSPAAFSCTLSAAAARAASASPPGDRGARPRHALSCPPTCPSPAPAVRLHRGGAVAWPVGRQYPLPRYCGLCPSRLVPRHDAPPPRVGGRPPLRVAPPRAPRRRRRRRRHVRRVDRRLSNS
eukprot:6199249-Pleurochrysis_carterae.AAC.1